MVSYCWTAPFFAPCEIRVIIADVTQAEYWTVMNGEAYEEFLREAVQHLIVALRSHALLGCEMNCESRVLENGVRDCGFCGVVTVVGH